MARAGPFEKHTAEYEDWFIRHKFAYQSELEAIGELLPRGEKGIEIGVGSGRFAAPLAIQLGLDPSAKMGRAARQRGVDVVGGVAEALPFKNSTFDFALMVTTICFVDDLDSSFREAHRILRPDGHLIIGFIDRASPIGQSYERRKADDLFYREATFYSVAEVTSVLRETHFREFVFSQTIFKNLADIHSVEPVERGYGKGSFVVLRAGK
ncbi:MAG: class I SAM-dependent methyltransferase [Chloroflexi bacterium]|nr:class I SAM-dependent methyltransferase [Chloroflexota bacterium]